jgi:hypothetical protein
VDDLVLMPKITEQDICANLEKRYFNDLIYVRSCTNCLGLYLPQLIVLTSQLSATSLH